MTPVDDLAAWLTQVWDEQEKDAQRAIDLTVDSYPTDKFNVWWRWARAYELRESGAGGFTTASGAPSPSEVLARIAADRQILASQLAPYPEGCAPNSLVMKLLAQPYADREGFRPEWKVS